MKKKQFLFLGILICALLFAAAASFAFGSKNVPITDVVKVLLHNEHSSYVSMIVLERIPRTLFALLAGAGLGMAGSIMQSVTRNPIADPSILGIHTGAALSVVIGIAFLNISTYTQYIWMALAGGAFTALLVYGIAMTGIDGATPIKLALSGAVISAALSSVVSAIMLPRSEVMNTYRFWQVGSVSGANYESILSILPFLLIGGVIAVLLAPSLNALALGDELASSLGVRTGRVRMLGAVCSVLLCGSITAIAGPIGFVGLMIPHVMRLLFGSDVRGNIALSAVGGAVLLLSADIIGRVLGSPGEVEVGIITAFLGAPVLMIIAMKAKVNAL